MESFMPSSLAKNTETSSFPDLTDANLLLVDDDPDMHEIVGSIAEAAGSRLTCAGSAGEARIAGERGSFDIALVDMMLPDGEGIEVIRRLRTAHPDISPIVITGYADHQMAYALENAGIRTVLTKPFSASQLRFTLCKEMARRKLLEREGALTPRRAAENGTGLVGNSEYVRHLRDKISVFAAADIPVLIEGPTGTGKEIIASAIHRGSSRSGNPMIVVNSSAIPEHLEESEFFGHAKGAFTGAYEEKAGIIECSNGSSLFLDEAGELSLRMQAKLLRVLDGHGYARVGDTTPRESDFRLISATNRPLLDMIREGSFRQDLYFRLKAGYIRTEPLTSHREDIPLLVRHFLFDAGQRKKKDFIITGVALHALMDYEWPGNIRELKNVLESLCTLNARTGTIGVESISWVIAGFRDDSEDECAPFSQAKLEFEKNFHIGLLVRHHGNISASAAEAGIDRPNFSRRLKALGIRASDYKSKSTGNVRSTA